MFHARAARRYHVRARGGLCGKRDGRCFSERWYRLTCPPCQLDLNTELKTCIHTLNVHPQVIYETFMDVPMPTSCAVQWCRGTCRRHYAKCAKRRSHTRLKMRNDCAKHAQHNDVPWNSLKNWRHLFATQAQNKWSQSWRQHLPPNNWRNCWRPKWRHKVRQKVRQPRRQNLKPKNGSKRPGKLSRNRGVNPYAKF